MDGSSIEKNLANVRAQMSAACVRAGRAVDSVRLIAVSKTKPLALLEAAIKAGQKSFGENYVQEAVEKIAALPSADWHFIGSLQSNKVRQIVGRVALIHSVDRLKLANEISRVAVSMGVVQDVLVQVNIGGEATKHGAELASGLQLLTDIRALPAVRVRGLMSLPPLSEDESVSRGYFAQLRGAFETWRVGHSEFTELSMGTSSDFQWAILEGATLVRVGTAIFGARE